MIKFRCFFLIWMASLTEWRNSLFSFWWPSSWCSSPTILSRGVYFNQTSLTSLHSEMILREMVLLVEVTNINNLRYMPMALFSLWNTNARCDKNVKSRIAIAKEAFKHAEHIHQCKLSLDQRVCVLSMLHPSWWFWMLDHLNNNEKEDAKLHQCGSCEGS